MTQDSTRAGLPATTTGNGSAPAPARDHAGAVSADSRYKWIALSNITLGTLMVFINQSIVLIALPAIFRGIHLNPLTPANTGYMLWMLMGFMVVLAVLVGDPRPGGRHVRAGEDVQPRLRRLHRLLDPALDHLDARAGAPCG